jgi:hypothetical protein
LLLETEEEDEKDSAHLKLNNVIIFLSEFRIKTFLVFFWLTIKTYLSLFFVLVSFFFYSINKSQLTNTMSCPFGNLSQIIQNTEELLHNQKEINASLDHLFNDQSDLAKRKSNETPLPKAKQTDKSNIPFKTSLRVPLLKR